MGTCSAATHRTSPGSSALRESEASATKHPAGMEINLHYRISIF
ncbi:hypothetical protein [Lysinibacillus sp. TE18511]